MMPQMVVAGRKTEIYSLDQNGELTTVDLLASNKALRDEVTQLKAEVNYAEDELEASRLRNYRLRLKADGQAAHSHIDLMLTFTLGFMTGVVLLFGVWSAHGMLHP